MSIIATWPVPTHSRLDAASTAQLPAPDLARRARRLFDAGVSQADMAALLDVTATEALELVLDDVAREHGWTDGIGLRPTPTEAVACSRPGCTSGPHEAYPTDPYDDGARLHMGDGTTLLLPGSIIDEPVEVVVTPEWLEGSGDAPKVHVGAYENTQCSTELLLSAEQAERLAAELLTAARAARRMQAHR